MRGDAHDGLVEGFLALGAQAVKVQAVLAPLPVLEVGPFTHALCVVEPFRRRGAVGRTGGFDVDDLDARRDRGGGGVRGGVWGADLGGIVTG